MSPYVGAKMLVLAAMKLETKLQKIELGDSLKLRKKFTVVQKSLENGASLTAKMVFP